MVKKICIFLLFVLTSFAVLPTSEAYALSRSEKQSKCEALKAASKATPQNISYKGSIVPISLLQNFQNTVQNISGNLVTIQVLGDSLMCHAVHGDYWNIMVGDISLFRWANIPIWLCGAIIYCFGFMLVLSVTFYIVDVSFKLGFAIIVLPVAIGLWPFSWTKDKLMVCISVFLKSAGILIFLSLTTAYALNMLAEALGGLPPVMEALTENKTAEVSETFSLTSGQFLLVVVVLIYGMKMIGSTIPDYVDKFFPDDTFGSGKKASPMHMLSTQGLDFVKQKAVAPAAKFAHDVARTQSGRLVSGAGKLMQGKYHNQIKNGLHKAGVAIRNPKATAEKIGNNLADKGVSAIGSLHKGYNNFKFGAKSALGSAMLAGKGKEAFQAHVEQQKNAANANVNARVSGYQQQFQANKDNLNAQINANEAQRNANPSALHKFAQNAESKISNLSQKASNWHQTNQNEAQRKLDKIDNERDKKLIRTDKLSTWLNKGADAVKNNAASKWYREKITGNIDKATNAINNWQQRVADKVNNGALAENKSDGWGKWALKRVARGVANGTVSLVAATPAKLATRTASLITKAPDAVFRTTVDTLNKAVQTTARAVTSVPNAAINAYYGIKKVPAGFKKHGDKVLQGVENIWKVPGKILEGTGDAMQHNKPRDYSDDDDRRRRDEEEERERKENT